ncbi:hypothetical protein PSHT_12109 [Puccinia striiformis]|uniref:Uncharacterized protein n=2 Tax=Puccinia striiformis TaxID=27350 RepID=A0A2S4UVN5_9BASI|nr:hypothetical protein PSTT_12559 [Puccinia striiformis]POW02394.1 hypothetical protein PSHT_12109 [Puccinia striiformis]
MVFIKYNTGTKVAFVRLLLQGQSQRDIRNLLGYSVSRQLLDHWRALFNETRSVIQDLTTYEAQG